MMHDVLRHILSGILPLVAIASLVVGPSSAAICADYQHRLDIEDAASPSEPGAGRTAGATSDSPAQPLDDSEFFASFVAPASAKPAQSQWSNTLVAATGNSAFGVTPRRLGRQIHRSQGASFRGLHPPAYRAHAPPIA